MKLTKRRVVLGVIVLVLTIALIIDLMDFSADIAPQANSASAVDSSSARAALPIEPPAEFIASDADGVARIPVAHGSDSEPIEPAAETSDVAPHLAPLALSARVVDENGGPVQRAELFVTLSSASSNLMLVGVRDPTSGLFEVRAEGLSADLNVRVDAPGYMSAYRPRVAAGTKELLITIARAARLTSDVVADPNIDLARLELCAIVGKSRWCFGNDRAAQGHFEVDMDAGVARIEVVASETGWVITAIDEVFAPGGGVVSDARVARIDVRGMVREQRLQVRDQNGIAFAGKALRIQDGNGKGREIRADEAGRIAVLVPTGMKSLYVMTRETGRIEVPCSSEERELSFTRQ